MKINNQGNYSPSTRDELSTLILSIFKRNIPSLSFTDASFETALVRAFSDTVYSEIQPSITSTYNNTLPTKAIGRALDLLFYPRLRRQPSLATGFIFMNNPVGNGTLTIPVGTQIRYQDNVSSRMVIYNVIRTVEILSNGTDIAVPVIATNDFIGTIGNLQAGIRSVGTSGVTVYQLSFTIGAINYPQSIIGFSLTSGSISGGAALETDIEYRSRISSEIYYGNNANSEFGLLGSLLELPIVRDAKLVTNNTNEYIYISILSTT